MVVWEQLLAPGSEITGPRTIIGDVPVRPEPKTVWSVDGIGALLDALAEARVAVGRGHVLVEQDGVLSGLAPADAEPGRLLGPEGFFWQCSRAAGEGWGDFAARSVKEARDVLRRASYAHTGPGEAFADLACVGQDETALFELPRYARDAWERLAETGDFSACHMQNWEAVRVRHAGAVAGSVYGAPASRVSEIPAEARFAQVEGRARDIGRIAETRELRILEVAGARDDALAAAAQLPGLHTLVLREPRAATLDALEGCGARVIVCSGAARVRDASVLACLPRLQALWIDVSGIRELEFLRRAGTLRSLLFTGGLTTLPTLEPLSGLHGLRHLHVGHVRVRDKSLRPLHALAALETLRFPDRFPLEEIAALAGALPATAGLPDEAVFTTELSAQLSRCPRCRSADVVLTVGSPVRTLCRACDDAKIRKHALRWEIALASAVRGPAVPRPALSAPLRPPVTLVRLGGA